MPKKYKLLGQMNRMHGTSVKEAIELGIFGVRAFSTMRGRPVGERGSVWIYVQGWRSISMGDVIDSVQPGGIGGGDKVSNISPC